jgi:hypothetical protein
MFSLAAAHPAAFAAFIDCYMRSPALEASYMLAAVGVLAHAALAVLGCAGRPLGALDDTAAAAASLASALTSFVKRAVQYTQAAVMLQGQTAAVPAQGGSQQAAVHFPAALFVITQVMQGIFASSLLTASQDGAASSEAAGGVMLLSVVAARSLVQLADAMQGAGPQLLCRSLTACPKYISSWDAERGDGAVLLQQVGPGSGNARMRWHTWQRHMLQAMLQAVRAFTRTGAPAGHAGAAATAATAAASTSGEPSSAEQAKWGYLLQVQQYSERWAAAVAAFDAKWPDCRDDVPGCAAVSAANSGDEVMRRTEQQYTDALELCRALAAAVPLPLACNYLGCESLHRVSEAAAASKRCTRCKARYCSAVCQKADWERHKQACKGMATAGLACK